MPSNPVLAQGRRLKGLIRRPRPLPLTLATILALVITPALLLLRWPRPQARGLERLLSVAALLQSFPADPTRPVPPLWQQRLGAELAPETWRRQRRLWWQFWGRHGDAGAFLALPASQLPRRPPTAIPLDDLVVLAPDPLSRQLLLEQLRLHQRPPRGLEQRCLQRLLAPQGVYWSAVAVGTMAGPLAPLLQRVQQGCLTLSLNQAGLAWSGEAGASPGLLAPPPAPGSAAATPRKPAPELLLEIHAGSLAALLQGLTSRPFIRDPLERRYGLPAAQLAQLGRAPFQLRLRPQAQGPFKASLELQVAVGRRQPWVTLLKRLEESLVAQGFEQQPLAAGLERSDLLPNATWQRSDATIVGGWRWLLPAGGQAQPQLLLFLGPPPAGSLAGVQRSPAPQAHPGMHQASDSVGAAGLAPADLTLVMRPSALQQRGLLPADLPEPVRRAETLHLELGGGGGLPGQAISRVTGGLRLAP